MDFAWFGCAAVKAPLIFHCCFAHYFVNFSGIYADGLRIVGESVFCGQFAMVDCVFVGILGHADYASKTFTYNGTIWP